MAMTDSAGNTYSALISRRFTPEQNLQSRKTTTTSENGTKYSLCSADSNPSAVFQVDGVILTEGEKCDKLILVQMGKDSWAECFVELKGTDIGHAIKQLEETVNKPVFKHQTNKNIRARIVGRSFPSNRSDDTIEKAKIRFMRKHKCDLRCFKNGQKDNL